MRLKIGDRVLTHRGAGVVVYVGWNFVEVLRDGTKHADTLIFVAPPITPVVRLEPEET